MAAAAVAAAYPYTFYTAAAASNIYDVGKLLENSLNSLKIQKVRRMVKMYFGNVYHLTVS
jgi:hypothetical protein